MTRLALTLTTLLMSTTAYAAEDTVTVRAAGDMRRQVTAAAAQVCAAAIKHHPFDDYGSMDECIENTLAVTRRIGPAQMAVATR